MKYKKLISLVVSALCVSLISAATAFADEATDTATDEIYETESYSEVTEDAAENDDAFDEADNSDDDADDVDDADNDNTKDNEPIYYNIGDVNNDRKVDASDASEILEYYSLVSTKQPVDWSESRIWAGDVNGDGITDSSDASHILSYYSYASTLPKGTPQLDILEFIENPPVTTTVPTTTRTTTTTTTVTTTTTTVNYVLAPKGLSSGTKGSIQYIVNTAKLQQRDSIRFYNIKYDNGNNGNPIENKTLTHYLTDDAIAALNRFAKEHFTDTMTNYDRLKYTWEWLHYNVQYADGLNGRPSYWDISELSYAEACFDKKAGQCIQYNGALAEMMAYMGYDVYMIEMYTSGQHFRTEVSIDGVAYGIEVGEAKFDNPPGYYWMWFFDSSKAHIAKRP